MASFNGNKWCVQQCSCCGRFLGKKDESERLSCHPSDSEHSHMAHFDPQTGIWYAMLTGSHEATVSTPSGSGHRNRQQRHNSPRSPNKTAENNNFGALLHVSEETLAFFGGQLSDGSIVSLNDAVVARLTLVTPCQVAPFYTCILPKFLHQSYFDARRLVKIRRVKLDQVIDTPSVHLLPQFSDSANSAVDLAMAKGDNNTDSSKKEMMDSLSQLAKGCLSANFFHNDQPIVLSSSTTGVVNATIRVPSVFDKNSTKKLLAHVDVSDDMAERFDAACSLTSEPIKTSPSLNRCDSKNELSFCDETALVYRLSRDKDAKIVFRDSTLLDPDLPSETFRALCGQNVYNQLISFFMAQALHSSDLFRMGFRPPRGLLLHGSAGTGKSSLCAFLADLADTHAVVITADRVFTRFYGDCEATLRSLFDNAIRCAPSTIIIDDIDVFCSKGEAEKKLIACLCSLLDMVHRLPASVRLFVLAATSKLDSVDASLRRYGRLDREVELLPPDAASRRSLFSHLLSRSDHVLSDRDVEALAEMTSSFVAADIRALCTEAALKFCFSSTTGNESKSKVTTPLRNGAGSDENGVGLASLKQLALSDFTAVVPRVRPTARRDICIEVPRVHWHDIGGLDDVKQRLRQCVEWPLRHAAALIRLGLRPPKGALLYGPPGCSKTLIARAMATESGLAFLSIKGPELFNKWLGESERAVRQLFRRARQASPSIIFFDEVDAIAPARSGGPGGSSSASASSASERVVAQLLTELDGIQELDHVFVLAATNRPDVLDTAILRPGRLDRLIYVPLPDDATRRQILAIQFAKTPVKSGHGAVLEHLIENLAARTEGFTGAEVVSLVQEAAFHALERSEFSALDVRESDLEYAFSVVKPRTDTRLLKSYEAFSLAH